MTVPVKIIENEIYIVGAHSRGRTFKEYVTALYPETVVKAFLVDDLSENKRVIDGVPVRKICRESELEQDCAVYVATRGIYYEKIEKELRSLGMQMVYPVDAVLDSSLRNRYVRKVFADRHREFCSIDECDAGDGGCGKNLRTRIYVAASAFDQALQSAYELLPEESLIQVGTALTDKKLEKAEAFDDTGVNISDKNKQFCELTALYWIWKNATEDIVGLVHYRRHFLLPDRWLDRMLSQHIDVILPVPLYVAPSVEDNYKERHDPSDWEYMMEYLKANLSADYEASKRIFQKGLYSPCNMFIMKKEVLNGLCEWLFPILDAVISHGGTKEDAYLNRYPGFLAERLLTYYFEAHGDQYKVAYANKNFLV